MVYIFLITLQVCRREIRICTQYFYARQAPVENLMTIRLTNQAALDSAVRRLIKRDARLKPVLAVSGMPALQARPAGFEGLAQIVCGQQVSVAAAAAIWGRVSGAYSPFDHHSIRRARVDRLSRLGLSSAKIKTLKMLATEIVEDRLNLEALADQEADAAHDALIALHGIGPWTADVYLLFCLGHGDAWPAGDIALQEAVKVGLGFDLRPSAKQMVDLGEPWRPHRGAAALLWWAYYQVIKKREGVIGGAAKQATSKPVIILT